MRFEPAIGVYRFLIDGSLAHFFSSVILLGIFAQWLSWKFRFPSILALLVFGFIAGQFFDQSSIVNDDVVFAVVSLSVAIVMLEGGLTLHISLATILNPVNLESS